MTTLVVLSVVDIVLLIAGLAIYLFIVGGQLERVATNLEECSELVGKIVRDAEVIEPGVERINRTGGSLPVPFRCSTAWRRASSPGQRTSRPRPPSAVRRSRLPGVAGRDCMTRWATRQASGRWPRSRPSPRTR